MSFATSFKLSLAVMIALVAAVSAVPNASAGGPSPASPQLPCQPVLPLYPTAICAVGVTVALVDAAYVIVTCDVIGGPACGFNVCAEYPPLCNIS